MKKQRYYRAGAVFELNGDCYILTRVDGENYNLISLENDSNRWTQSVRRSKLRYRRPPGFYSFVADCDIRKLVGTNGEKLRKYKYLGQFDDVFKRTGDKNV